MAELVFRWLREGEVHAGDLGLGDGAADWPETDVDEQRRRLVAGLSRGGPLPTTSSIEPVSSLLAPFRQPEPPFGTFARLTAVRDAYRTAMRADLLVAAECVIERTGLTGLTLGAILDEAGVAPGTLYSSFSGTEEILETGASPAELLDIVGDALTRRAGTNTFVTDVERVGRTALDLLTAPLCTTTDRPTRSRR